MTEQMIKNGLLTYYERHDDKFYIFLEEKIALLNRYKAEESFELIPLSFSYNTRCLSERMNVIPVGPRGMQLMCPSCHAIVESRVEHKANIMTHIMAVLLCIFLCWPCVCVPYYIESCQNANHYCPNCSAYLGTYV